MEDSGRRALYSTVVKREALDAHQIATLYGPAQVYRRLRIAAKLCISRV
jgi:hypothetical protein